MSTTANRAAPCCLATGTMTTTSHLPTGTVTFFFSDVEGSTGLLQRLAAGYREVIEEHAEIIRRCLAEHRGTEVSTEGDSFFAVFTSASDAVAAAADVQKSLAAATWPPGGTVAVRIGLHTGTGELGHDNYVGIDVNRAARIGAAGHGGQVVGSETVRVLAFDADFSDLGEHELKGLERAEHLYQLNVPGLAKTFPPLRTKSARPNNLPALASVIVGREAEVSLVEGLLDEHRLVTIAGPGGIGKTRLALEVASDVLPRFERGAFLVDLGPVDDAQLVLPAISATIGVDEVGTEGLAAALTDGPRLLVLDNFEQVVEAAPDLGSIIDHAAPLKVLVTSQLPLRLGTEQVFRLDPLALSGEISPAIELFTARALQADPAFDLDSHRTDVASLVEALDGVPLAIELAAARVNVLTPGQVLERLETGYGVLKTGRSDASERHRSIEATVGWSYGLLEPSQQDLLQALAVFRGGADMDALEYVADRDAIDDLAELVDRSLVQTTPGTIGKRFDLLAPVHHYVQQNLIDSASLPARHADFFADLAVAAREPLEGDTRAKWIAILGDDHDNLRATLDYLLAAGDISRGFDLLGNIWRFFHSTGQLNELAIWLPRFFEADQTGQPNLARARALLARAALHYWRGQWPDSAADYREALAIAETHGDQKLIAESLTGLSDALGNARVVGQPLGDPAEPARRAHEIFVELGDSAGVASIEMGRTIGAAMSGPDSGPPDRAALQRIIELYQEAGSLMYVAHTQMMLAGVDHLEGNYGEARRNLLVSLDTAEQAGDSFAMAWGLRWMAVMIVYKGDPLLGARLAGAAEVALERMGGHWPETPFINEKAQDLARATLGTAADEAFAAGKQMDFMEAIRLARAEAGAV